MMIKYEIYKYYHRAERGEGEREKTSVEILHVNILHHVSLLKNKSETQITYGAINTFG